jgi:hypothetical protein
MSGLAQITLPDGSVRRLGNNRPKNGLTKVWREYGTTPETPLIPRSEWAARIRAIGDGPDFKDLPPVHDQDGVGQCNCDDTTAALESLRMSQGLPYVKLSAADLYGRINGGVDEGSTLEDAMHEIMTNGVGTAATSGTLWRPGMTPAPPSERTKYRVLEAFLCPTFDHCMSAVIEGFRLSSGIEWFTNYNPNADGWLPVRRIGLAGGHAVFGYKPATTGFTYGLWHLNSWGANWGLQGCCVFPESAYKGQVGGWWALRSAVDEGGVVPAIAA